MDLQWLNWFLGSLTIELWVGAWGLAFEPEIRRWWASRRMR
jgi:hypothetical protein